MVKVCRIGLFGAFYIAQELPNWYSDYSFLYELFFRKGTSLVHNCMVIDIFKLSLRILFNIGRCSHSDTHLIHKNVCTYKYFLFQWAVVSSKL